MLNEIGGDFSFRQVQTVCDVYWLSTLRKKINAKKENSAVFNEENSIRSLGKLSSKPPADVAFGLGSASFSTMSCAA